MSTACAVQLSNSSSRITILGFSTTMKSWVVSRWVFTKTRLWQTWGKLDSKEKSPEKNSKDETHPSFSILCLLHMLTAVFLTRALSVRLLTTMPSISGPAKRSCLAEKQSPRAHNSTPQKRKVRAVSALHSYYSASSKNSTHYVP